MDNDQHHNEFPPLTADQIRELADVIREVFGGNLSRTDFTDKLLMFLEDVPGYESGEVAVAVVESVWAEYVDRRGRA
jgi:hypothetical protein